MLRAPADDVLTAAETADLDHDGFFPQVKNWLLDEGPWWSCSFIFHFVLLCALALLGGQFAEPPSDPECYAFTPADAEVAEEMPPLDTTPIIPPLPPPPEAIPRPEPDLTLASLPGDNRAGQGRGGSPEASSDVGVNQGDLNPALGNVADSTARIGPISPFVSGIGPKSVMSPGTSTGSLNGHGNDLMLRRGPHGLGTDFTRASERGVASALRWLARHQLLDGAWSLQGYVARCTDATCTGPGATQADSAATAMGLLPFLAANQTHRRRGEYQKTVAEGLAWLVRHQKPDGDLRCGSTMYAHGLATIALCEAFAMTGDRAIAYAAQRAVDFLTAAQNPRTGGWRYNPGDDGDLSVVGWQVMALKSAQMAGLKVEVAAMERAKRFLAATSAGDPNTSAGRGQFAYTPGAPSSPAMTSVGLLCAQYLGTGRNDARMTGGTAHLMQHLPDASERDLYYWYYATQVMHNQPGPEWDVWNRKIRTLLVESQNREGCAAGSWDPQHPTTDRWGVQGGRLMTTSLAALTLEVYYRYLPLYQCAPAKP
jgi:hypothetical protein